VTGLLLLHPIGLDGGAGDWLDLPAFDAPDLPGHGSSAAQPVGSLDDLADAVAAGLTQPADVIGALLGGAVGLHLALRHPELVRSLVLAGTDSKLNEERLRTRADAVLDGSFGPDDILPSWYGENLDDPGRSPQVDYTRSRLRAMSPQNYAAAWRALSQHDVDARLGELRMPVTVIAASADLVHPGSDQESLSRRLPLGRSTRIDAHHMAWARSVS
jgi:3-oxoadipate enol-lactonase